jgi:hypothetical protein
LTLAQAGTTLSTMSHRAMLLCAWITLGALGCSSSSHGTAFAADASAPGDGGRWSPACPASPPMLMEQCSLEGVQCEFQCGTLSVECKGSVWQKYGTIDCSPESGSNPAGCPSVRPAAGAVCGGPIVCGYSDSQCSCDTGADGSGPTWACGPGPGCPFPRPRLGSPCSGTLFCTYPGAYPTEACQQGVWQNQALSF